MLVIYKEPRVQNVGGHFQLVPGVNEVDPKAWEEGMKIELFRDFYVDGGLVQVLRKAGDDIAGAPEKEALRIVRETLNEELLAKWQGSEKRPAVTKAIDGQLELIALKKEKADDHEE